MDSNPTRTLHPRDIIHQLAESMNGKHDELSVTIPAYTTWRSALQAVESALNGVDEPFIVFPHRNTNRRAMRELGLQAAAHFDSENVQALPIRTSVDLERLEPRPPLSEEGRERLRQMAREIANMEFRYPYASLRPTLEDSFLPMIRADLTVQGLDGHKQDPVCELHGVNMIFDTGAHMTLIAEELLCPSFQEYLRDSVHDSYRGRDGLSVQVDAGIYQSPRCRTSWSAYCLDKQGALIDLASGPFLGTYYVPVGKRSQMDSGEIFWRINTSMWMGKWFQSEHSQTEPLYSTAPSCCSVMIIALYSHGWCLVDLEQMRS